MDNSEINFDPVITSTGTAVDGGSDMVDERLGLLRETVAELSEAEGRAQVADQEVTEMLELRDEFLGQTEHVIYGGAAINAHLPEGKKIYDYSVEIPDYDAMVADAWSKAQAFADILHANGIPRVEARPGFTEGTYKVFGNGISILDLHETNPSWLSYLAQHHSLKVGSLCFAGLMYLRMSMYQELATTKGDKTRWEKVFQRLQLLNDEFPYAHESVDSTVSPLVEASHTKQLQLAAAMKLVKRSTMVLTGLSSVVLRELTEEFANDKDLLRLRVDSRPGTADIDVLSDDPAAHVRQLVSAISKASENPIGVDKLPGSEHTPFFSGSNMYVILDKTTGERLVNVVEIDWTCMSYNDLRGYRVASLSTLFVFLLSLFFDPRVKNVIGLPRLHLLIETLLKYNADQVEELIAPTCYGKQDVDKNSLLRKRWDAVHPSGASRAPGQSIERPYVPSAMPAMSAPLRVPARAGDASEILEARLSLGYQMQRY